MVSGDFQPTILDDSGYKIKR